MMKTLAPGLLSWASILEATAEEQARTTAALPWVKGLALMPDAHWGMGSTVGSVVATDDVVMPACVGVDIGCGMSSIRTDLNKADIEFRSDNRPLSDLRLLIQGEVPVSAGKYRTTLSESAERACGQLEVDAASQDVNLLHSPKWREQLGTLGGGNHFIELSYDEQDRVWIFLHSGSRGVGNKIAQKHIKIARAQCEAARVDLPHPDLAYLVRGTDEFDEYIRELHWAQAFAAANRAEMVKQVQDCLELWWAGPVRRQELISCHHNYTERDGDFLITRKGAIDASAGKRGLIPGSMGTRSYVVTGLGNEASFNSAPHGAGRNFSRKEARRRFTAVDLAETMQGVEWRSDIAEELVDEIPGAYKDIDVIMEDAKDLVRVDHTLRQFLNIKGS